MLQDTVAGIPEYLQSVAFLRQFFPRHAEMLRAVRERFGMRHKAENPARGAAEAGDGYSDCKESPSLFHRSHCYAASVDNHFP
jgi:hypothetical protein